MFKKTLFFCLSIAFIVLGFNEGFCEEKNTNKGKNKNRVEAMTQLNYDKIQDTLKNEFEVDKLKFLKHVDDLMTKGTSSTKKAVTDLVYDLIRDGSITLQRDTYNADDTADKFYEYFDSSFDYDDVDFFEGLLGSLNLKSGADVENLISVMSLSGIRFVPSSIAECLLTNLEQDEAFRAFEWLVGHKMVGFSDKGDDVGDYIENWLIETKGQPCWYRFSR